MVSVKRHLIKDNVKRCPCRRCENTKYQARLDMAKHIVVHGFVKDYTGGSAMVKHIVREMRSLGNASRLFMLKLGAET
jgi:hypothetical protein